MPATLTKEEILRRLEVCAPFILPLSYLLPFSVVFNSKSPLFPGFSSRSMKKRILIDVSKTVFMPICSIISRLCVGDISFLLYCKNPADNSDPNNDGLMTLTFL